MKWPGGREESLGGNPPPFRKYSLAYHTTSPEMEIIPPVRPMRNDKAFLVILVATISSN